MGRAPCCDKANVKKGPWSPEEDSKLKTYIETCGTGGNWIALPQKAGLRRCGKSCRLRWLNYLRPNLKHGDFTEYEDRVICTLFANIGSRWSIIAGQLPGRTDNDIKNYWNTKLKKKLLGLAHPSPQAHITKSSQTHSSSLFQNHPISAPSLNYYNNNNNNPSSLLNNTTSCCSEIGQIHHEVNPNMHYYVKENSNSNLLVFGSDQASCSSSDGSCSNSKQDHHHHHHHNHEMGYVHGFMNINEGFGEIPSDYDQIVDFNKLLLSSSNVDYGFNVFNCVDDENKTRPDDEKKEGMDMSPQYYYSKY